MRLMRANGRGSRLSLNLRKRVLSPLPGAAQRHRLGGSFSFFYPFPLTLAVRMISWPSVAVSGFVAKHLVGILRGVPPDMVVGRHDDKTGGTITVDIDLPALSVGAS